MNCVHFCPVRTPQITQWNASFWNSATTVSPARAFCMSPQSITSVSYGYRLRASVLLSIDAWPGSSQLASRALSPRRKHEDAGTVKSTAAPAVALESGGVGTELVVTTALERALSRTSLHADWFGRCGRAHASFYSSGAPVTIGFARPPLRLLPSKLRR